MKVLLVEDDQFKSANILRYLKEEVASATVSTARSLAAASALLQTEMFDILILDMSLPTYSIDQTESGGRPQGFGGMSVLRLVDSLGVPLPTIVVTQFEHFGEGEDSIDLAGLKKMLVSEFSGIFRDLVFYDAASESWKSELGSVIAAFRKAR